MIGALSTLSAADPGLSPQDYQVRLAPGTSVGSYLNALQTVLGKGYLVSVNDRSGTVLPALLGLIAIRAGVALGSCQHGEVTQISSGRLRTARAEDGAGPQRRPRQSPPRLRRHRVHHYWK